MSKIKNELEELSFRYLEPAAYETLKARVDAKRRATEGSIEELKAQISSKLADAQVPVVAIDGRIKPDYMVVGGKFVVKEGQLCTVEQGRLIEKHNRAARRLLAG